VKVCLLGDFAVGKTSLVSRFVHDAFSDKYLSTIGVKVSRKTVAVVSDDAVVELTIMLWDLAGSEEFNQMRASYLRGAAGALLVCDLARPTTLENLGSYVEDLRQVSPAAKLAVVANKMDLLADFESSLQQERLAGPADFAAMLGVPCFVTSAKTGDQVEDAFRHLGRTLVVRSG
jgi:small GTP-binding protein